MQRLISFLAIAIVLTACQPSVEGKPATSPALPTATVEVLPTSTIAPTQIPATPTATRDPNMPPDATGKDALGNYVKTVMENEKQVTYTWETLSIGTAGETMSGWFASHIQNPSLENGILLIDQAADGYNPAIPFTFDFKQGVSGPYLQHPDNPESSGAPSFTRVFVAKLTERYYGKILPEVSVADMQKFNTDFYNGSIVISFSTPGENYEWKPGPTIGVKFYAVKWDDADPAKNPAFNETMDEMEGNSLTYRWAVSTDAQGNLIVVAAVKNPLQLTDKQFFGWLLHPIELVLKEEQIPAHVRGWGLPTYPSELVSYVNKVQPAEFIILPNH